MMMIVQCVNEVILNLYISNCFTHFPTPLTETILANRLNDKQTNIIKQKMRKHEYWKQNNKIRRVNWLGFQK